MTSGGSNDELTVADAEDDVNSCTCADEVAVPDDDDDNDNADERYHACDAYNDW